jgi:peptidoglycan hydrolase-like protein with peptidoglycan-binding domain
MPVALAGAGVVGAVTTVAVLGGGAAPAAPPPVRVSVSRVVRTNLATTVLTSGTLGYGPTRPITNQLAGTYTSLPAVGRTITAGHALYRVDDQPAMLMIGRTPAWRPFVPGMTPGPDVRELQSNLIALGYASGLFSAPYGVYDQPTIDAVERWQVAAGYQVTGQIALGQVAFEPSAIKVGAMNVALGQAAQPGQSPYLVTTSRRTVIVPVNPTLPSVSVGERVSIVLPSSIRTPGVVIRIGPPPAASTGSAGPTVPAGTTAVLTVRPDRPSATGTGATIPVQISLTVQSVHDVLAVPVSALLALAGGGYGLEIVEPSGAHRLIGVRTGIFAGGLVQVSGAGLVPGTKVVIAS